MQSERERTIYNKAERCSFESACVVWVAKCLKGEWFIIGR